MKIKIDNQEIPLKKLIKFSGFAKVCGIAEANYGRAMNKAEFSTAPNHHDTTADTLDEISKQVRERGNQLRKKQQTAA